MQKAQKTSFPKESVENADFYKPVLNKIMTTHKSCAKYNFVAPLKDQESFVSFILSELLYKDTWKKDNAFIETNKEGKRLLPTDSVKYLGNKVYKNITWRNN